MFYFSYHATAKKLIRSGKLTYYEFVDKWNSVSPALVLYFSCHPPLPIRKEHWQEYMELIEEQENKN